MVTKPKPGAEDDFDLGIDVGTLTEAERPLYEKLNAQVRKAYLTKTQKLAEQRKAWEDEQGKLRTDYEEANKQLLAWNDWWTREGQYQTPREQRASMREEGLEDPNVLMEELRTLRGEWQQASRQYNEVLTQLKGDLEKTHMAMGLQNQLFDLRLKHPDADPMRIIDTAKERGIKDMDLAYQLAYGEEIKSKEVETKVNERLEEEKAKMAAEKAIVDTKPSTTKYAPPPEAKSYGEASNNLLGAIRQTGGLLDKSS